MSPSAAHWILATCAVAALPGGGAASAAASDESVPPAAALSFVAPATASPPAEAPPAIDDAAWLTGPDIGTGVAMKDTGNPLGDNAFIGYAGYDVPLADAEAWVDALDDAWLREHGVRYVWAVRGPDDSHYENKEIGNTKIGTKLREIAPTASFILVAAHSSGSCVAHELFTQLADGRDGAGTTAGKLVYFDLDGIEKGLSASSVARLRSAYFVGAVDPTTHTVSPNQAEMRRTATLYDGAASGGYVEYDATNAGCARGGTWCLHVSLVTNAPHDTHAARGHLDYTDFSRGGVATAFFEAKATEAGLAAAR
jgi:hypothetical protein